MTASPVRVVVVDDSPAARDAICAVLAEDSRIAVVGTAADGVEAIERASTLAPDVLTIDVGMPALDGISAIDVIMAESPTRIVVVASVDEANRDDLCFRAIGAGALELVAKPSNRDLDDFEAWGARLRQTVALMAEVPVVRRSSGHIPVAGLPRRPSPARARPVDAFGLVASTGGPSAIARILRALPTGLPFPVLVVQHITEGFAAGLARWLSTLSALPVELAGHGVDCLAGHVYVAPDGHHLEVTSAAGGRLRTRLAAGGGRGHVPSGDRLLHSLARLLGPRAAAVVLTGMGEDGADGLLAVRRAGGIAWAQDESSSTVYGMPRAAFERGGAAEVIPLSSIAASISACCHTTTNDPWRRPR